MKVPTVEKFFCVFDLNLGGLILGWFGAISNASLALLLIIDYLFYEDKLEEDAKEITGNVEELSPGLELISMFNTTTLPTEINAKQLSPKASALIVMTFVGILSSCCIISLFFIRGVEERNSNKVKPFLVLIAVGICSAFIHGIFSLSFYWIVVGMCHVYFFIVVYSIYELLQFEGEQKNCHQSAVSSQGYSQCYEEPELYSDPEKGYQTSEFQGP